MASIILLTGGSSGIGYEAVRALSKSCPEARIITTGRSAPREPFPPNVAYRNLDLCSQDSIRAFVASWSDRPITHLVLNAGANVMGKPTFTPDGIESTFASNHTGHALLILLLVKEKRLADDCSIVFVTSSLHDSESPGYPAVLWSTPASVAACEDPRLRSEALVRYGTAKFGAMLFVWALRRRAMAAGKKWRINIFEPGFAPGRGSKLGRDLPGLVQTIAEGLVPVLRFVMRLRGLKTSDPLRSGGLLAKFTVGEEFKEWDGRYMWLDEESHASKDSLDIAKQDELWEWTVQKMAKDEDERKAFERL